MALANDVVQVATLSTVFLLFVCAANESNKNATSSLNCAHAPSVIDICTYT